MNNEFRSDQDLEAYLRSFRPAGARALRLPRHKSGTSMALAVGVLAVLVISATAVRFSYTGWREAVRSRQGAVMKSPAPELRSVEALEMSDDALELALARASCIALPPVNRPNSALSALAAE